MQGLLLAALILAHPLENVPVREIGCPMTSQPFSNNTVYVSPVDGVIERGKVVGYIGNTGLSLEPHLTVSFENSFDDLRAIYIKAK